MRLGPLLSADAQQYVKDSLPSTAVSALDKLLQADPARRHTVAEVLESSLFKAQTTQQLQERVDAARYAELKEVHARFDAVDESLHRLTVSLDSLFRVVLTVGTDVMPRLFLLLPGGPKDTAPAGKQSFWRRMVANTKTAAKALDVRRYLKNEFQLHLLCEMSGVATGSSVSGSASVGVGGVSCSPTQPMTLTDMKAFVKKALPVLKMGLKLAKAACAAGRLAGLPLPTLGDLNIKASAALEGAVSTTLAALANKEVLEALGVEAVDMEAAASMSAMVDALETGVTDM